MSEEAASNLNKWKQSINNCYDVFLTSKNHDQKTKLKHQALMARVVDDADKLAVQQVLLMSQLTATFQHENSEILKIMCDR